MTRRRNSLAIIRAAIADPVARRVLGSLSQNDLQLLSEHVSANTLAPALQPLIDHHTLDDAYAAMPRPISDAVKKLPPDALEGVKLGLTSLRAAPGDPVTCACK